MMVRCLYLLFMSQSPCSYLPVILAVAVLVACLFWAIRRPTTLTLLACLFFATAALVFSVGGTFSFFLRDGLGPNSIETTGLEAVQKVLPDLMGVVRLSVRLLDVGSWLALLSFVPRLQACESIPALRATAKLRAWALGAGIVGALWVGWGPLELLLFRYHPYWVARHGGVGSVLTDASLERVRLMSAALVDADLRGADLSEADLRWANLSGANLRECNLTGSRLCHADFSRACLTDATLIRSQLNGADLNEAWLIASQMQDGRLVSVQLRKSDLRLADLSGVDLSNSDLSYANLRGANLQKTKLTAVKLVGATYDRHTRWPTGFNPKQHGAIWMECAHWRDGGSDLK